MKFINPIQCDKVKYGQADKLKGENKIFPMNANATLSFIKLERNESVFKNETSSLTEIEEAFEK